MNNKLKKILKAREARYLFRCNLQQEYKLPVVVITLNIPGPDKNNQLINKVFPKIIAEITEMFLEINIIIRQKIIRSSAAGPEAFLGLEFKGDCYNLKRELIKIEQSHYLGRLLDLDLYKSNGRAVSRKSIARKERQCLLCEANARTCIIEKRHSSAELKQKIKTMILKYLNPTGSV